MQGGVGFVLRRARPPRGPPRRGVRVCRRARPPAGRGRRAGDAIPGLVDVDLNAMSAAARSIVMPKRTVVIGASLCAHNGCARHILEVAQPYKRIVQDNASCEAR